MAKFNLMCRRYAGFRPSDSSDPNARVADLGKYNRALFHDLFSIKKPKYILRAEFSNLLVQYCPDEALYLCDALCELRGVVQQSRISGFTLPYTEMLLSAIFAEGDAEPEYIVPTDAAWPELPEPEPLVIHSFCPSPNPAPTAPMTPTTPVTPIFESGLELSRTGSFDEDVKDEIKKYEPSVYSNYTTAPPDDALAEEESCPTTSTTGTSLSDHVRQYEVLLPSSHSIFGSELSLDRYSAQKLENSCTPRSQLIHEDYLDITRRDLNAVSSMNPRHSAPSPNTMNNMNERDPAFLGTLGLRPVPKTPIRNRPHSVLMAFNPRKESATKPQNRCVTSMSANRKSEGAKKRYLTFVNRLRRRLN